MSLQNIMRILMDDKYTPLWTAIGSIFTVVATIGIFIVYKQFKFEAWNKCQEIFINKHFTNDRKILFQHLSEKKVKWSKDDLKVAIRVAGKMDALCRLSGFLGIRFWGTPQMVKVWGNPIAKSWALLHKIVKKERSKTKWMEKWDAFEKIGKISLDKFKKDEKNHLMELGKSLAELYR